MAGVWSAGWPPGGVFERPPAAAACALLLLLGWGNRLNFRLAVMCCGIDSAVLPSEFREFPDTVTVRWLLLGLGPSLRVFVIATQTDELIEQIWVN